jgi:hypothetical protein
MLILCQRVGRLVRPGPAVKAGVGRMSETSVTPVQGGAAAAADAVTERHSVSFTLPLVGRVWISEPKHLPFYAGVAVLAVLEVVEWPVAAVVMVGKYLADNAHREMLRDFGDALESE